MLEGCGPAPTLPAAASRPVELSSCRGLSRAAWKQNFVFLFVLAGAAGQLCVWGHRQPACPAGDAHRHGRVVSRSCVCCACCALCMLCAVSLRMLSAAQRNSLRGWLQPSQGQRSVVMCCLGSTFCPHLLPHVLQGHSGRADSHLKGHSCCGAARNQGRTRQPPPMIVLGRTSCSMGQGGSAGFWILGGWVLQTIGWKQDGAGAFIR